MIARLHLTILGGGLGLSLVGLGFLSQIVTDRVRFDDRQTAVVNRYDEAGRQWQAYFIQGEQKAPAGLEAGAAPWTGHLRRADEALAGKNVSAAELAWHDAYLAALRSRRWEGMVEVGDAYVRIGEVTGGRKAAEAKARQIYLAALFRARNEGSLDGMLRTAEAFAILGDREVAERGVYMAQRLAARARDAQARARVNVVAKRVAARLAGRDSFEFDAF